MIGFAGPRARTLRREDITEHLRQQILGGLHLGRVAPGQRLPSTRVVAAELGVDQRRVTRAYHELVVDGLVDLRPRSGFYVAAESNGRQPHLPDCARWAVDTLVDAAQAGLRPIDVADQLRMCLASGQLIAACIECNDDQIHGLSTELETDYGFETKCVEVDRVGDADTRAVLREADLLVTTPFHKSAVRRLARELGKPHIAITIRRDLLRGIDDTLRQRDVYFVASDPRFAPKAASMFATVETMHQLHVLVLGRDELSVIPDEAPTYIMRRARELLGSHPLARRVAYTPSLFSPESKRAILSFIAQNNLDKP